MTTFAWLDGLGHSAQGLIEELLPDGFRLESDGSSGKEDYEGIVAAVAHIGTIRDM